MKFWSALLLATGLCWGQISPMGGITVSTAAATPTVLTSGIIEGSDNGGTANVTLTTTGATLIVIVCGSPTSACTITSVSNPTGWTTITGCVASANINIIYKYSPTTSSSDIFTVAGGGGNATFYAGAIVYVINNTTGASANANNCTGTGSGSPSPISTGAVTPTAGSIVVAGVMNAFGSFSSATVNGGFSTPTVAGNGGGIAQGSAYLLNAPASSTNPAFTVAGDDFAAAIAAFR